MTGLQTISFWAKASEPVNLELNLHTSDIEDWSDYQIVVAVGTGWEEFEIAIVDLEQPAWGNPQVALDLEKAVHLKFCIDSDYTNPDNGTFWIDDIYLGGYEWKP